MRYDNRQGRVPNRRRAFVTILDEPPRDATTAGRLAALDAFFSAIEASDEAIPEFERVKFNREVEKTRKTALRRLSLSVCSYCGS
jgi:hypothetical protein